MTDPKFERGDLVRHRASGELAVVVKALCDHDAASPQNKRFNGHYSISRGFREPEVSVAEFEIIPAPEATVCADGSYCAGMERARERGWATVGEESGLTFLCLYDDADLGPDHDEPINYCPWCAGRTD